MNRLDEPESTPKKRNLKQDEAVAREAITKSGRKVKRPAHLDSPERTPSASPSESRKSIALRAKKAVEPFAGTPSKRTAAKEQISPEATKSSRKTNVSARKTISEHMDTPKQTKENKQVAIAVDDAAGISKSGRKIKIPTKLMEFESDVLSSPRKLAASHQDETLKEKLAKTPGRSKTPAKTAVKTIAVEEHLHPDDDGEKHLVRKTPGRRAKSVAPDQLDVESARTPKRRGVSTLSTKEVEKEGSVSEQTHPKTPGKRAGKTLLALDVKASPKTLGRRAKSLAPDKATTNEAYPVEDASETEPEANKSTTKTPGRRVGKSMLHPAVHISRGESSDSMQAVPKTPSRRAAKSMIAANETTLGVESPRAQRKAATKTPGRRQKSVAGDKIDSIEEDTCVGKSEERKLEDNDNLHSGVAAIASTVGKIASAATEEPLSRSGRKLKPKKVFDYEQEEKFTEPNQTADQVSTDIKRKRKMDNADESMKSPTKKKIIENCGPQTPKLKNRLESNLSVLGAESPQMEKLADVSVSRSGRKIKPKKMFGFEDGVETSATFVHVTGSSSPTLNEETVEADNRDDGDLSTKTEVSTASTPSKRTTALAAIVEQQKSSVPMAIDQKMEGIVDGGETDKQRSFITKRGVDDHHHETAKAAKRQQHFIDEIDRATVSSEPPIIRTSIGFGKPKVQRQTLSEEVAKSDKDAHVGDAQALASSRSGRKIKPKKFFDTNDLTTAGRQSIINPNASQPVPVPIALSPKQQIVEEQENEKGPITNSVDNVAADEVVSAAEGIDIPEGSCKLANEAATVENASDDGNEQEQQHVTSLEPEKVTSTETEHSDVVMEPEEDVLGMKVQDEEVKTNVESSITTKEELAAQVVEINEETSIQTQEELAAQPVEEQSDVPEKQETTQDEGKGNQLLTDTHIPNVTSSDGSVAIVQQHGEDTALTESCLDAEVKQNPHGNSSAKDTDLAPFATADREEGSNITIDETVNETNVAIEAPQDVSGSAVDTKSEEEESEVVPTGSVIASTGMADDEMLDEASFGSIEYLEDEMSNIVEHVKKPPSPKEQTEEDSSVSASAIPSIVIVAETPVCNVLNETYSPVPQNSSIIDITSDTPGPVAAAAAPRTPDSKLTAQDANDECSPDKPPEVIEIMDSPAVAAFCKRINDDAAHGGDGGSATSTPLAVKPPVAAVAEYVDQEPLAVQFESRKRSLSASAADTTMKRNVTFHSPANSTMLVETIDERLMLKSLQDQQQQRQEAMETSSKSIGEKLRKPRKRSLSEHKPSEMKRNKISKLPNFKSIHANHFNRMESVADFMKRKESRAKQILSSCSPATKLLSRPVADASGKAGGVPSVEKKIPSSTTKPFIFKSAAGGIPVPSAGLFGTRTKEGPTAAKKPIASDTERMANRMKQFQTTFKPKQIGTDTRAIPLFGVLPSTSTNNAAGDRPVEQLRSKQSKILKGVRTNRRFELQMKHRDNLQHQ